MLFEGNYSEEKNLGSFQMVEDPEGVLVGGSFTTGFFFDGGFVTEEIVNQGIIDDPLDAHLVQEYIEYHLNEADVWEDRFAPGGHGVIFQYSVEPEAIKTEDGYVFNRQPNGSYTDGDMEWPSFKEFRETAHVEWKNVQGGFDV